MRYEKPEILSSTFAVSAIEGSGKGQLTPPDMQPHDVTIGAYQSDE